MRRRNHRKLFFPFGIISLTVLPVIGFQRITEVYAERTKPMNCIELNFPPSDTNFTGEKFSSLRTYTTFKLSSDTALNSIILNNARQLLNKIKHERDTLNGVHILFTDSTKYQDYIKAVDYSFEKFPAVFASYQNDFWSMYVNIDTTGWFERKQQQKREDEIRKNGGIFEY